MTTKDNTQDKLKEMQAISGYKVGEKLAAYPNSKSVQSLLKSISKDSKNDPYASSLLKGFKEKHSQEQKAQRLNELSVIFDQDKTKDKEIER